VSCLLFTFWGFLPAKFPFPPKDLERHFFFGVVIFLNNLLITGGITEKSQALQDLTTVKLPLTILKQNNTFCDMDKTT